MGALDTLKDAYEFAKRAHQAEIVEKLIDAQRQVLDLIQGEGERSIDLKKAQLRIHELESEIKKSKSLRFDFGLYWTERDDGTWDGPFNPPEYDKSGTLLRLAAHKANRSGHLVAGQKYYKNIIQLYLLWNSRIESRKLEKEREALNQRLSKMEGRFITPIGAD